MRRHGMLAFVFLLLPASLILHGFVPVGSASESFFSVVWLADTQYLSEKYPGFFDATCRWIVDNRDAYNIQMVVHTGDIVNDGANLAQWENANHSIGILLGSGVPYCWCAGNHDLLAGSWNGRKFAAFNVTVMRQKTYWEADLFDGKDTAVSFNFSGVSFLFVAVEFHANWTVLEWLSSLLKEHPDCYAVFATHDYLNESCGYDSWATDLRENVLANHSNVFMTLSGHYHNSGNANRTKVGTRDELFFDYQNLDSEKGGATMRILTFNMSGSEVEVKTYKPYSEQFIVDADNQFTLSIPPEAIPEFSRVTLPLALALLSVPCALSAAKRLRSRKVATHACSRHW